MLLSRPTRRGNPADRVLRSRVREPVRFPDLTERRALKLCTVPHYTSQSHFGPWLRQLGRLHQFNPTAGVVTPLYFVDTEVADLPLRSLAAFEVRGESHLAQTLDAAGGIDHLVREGLHRVLAPTGEPGGFVEVARAYFINVLTRFDPDPARRRVVALPPEWELGEAPSRVTQLPAIEDFIPVGRSPDFSERGAPVWHYDQTDPNQHVTATAYLRVMQSFLASALRAAGHDMRRVFFRRARIIYRKPCFRGEGYRRLAWITGEAPLVITGVFHKEDDAPEARPAVVVEVTLAQHEQA